MILDEIISLFVSLFSFLVEGIPALFALVFNLIAGAIEAVIGLFISGFSINRIERKNNTKNAKSSKYSSIVTLIIIIGLVGWFLVLPRVMNKEVTLVAKDGHSLPFAKIIIYDGDREQHIRTDNAGNITIPRFSTDYITLKDKRYIDKTWQNSEIESKLIAERTILGSGLDIIAEKLLKPKK